ncbi:MAG: sulfite exporter TauE/SafE family protein [Polyangiales bacterium]
MNGIRDASMVGMSWLDPLALATLGILAGALTTLAGLGGGVMLTLALALVWDPQRALAVAAPALLFGNLHRLFLFRRFAAWRPLVPFLVGAVPGALVGGFVAVALPETALRLVLVGAVGLAVARELVQRAKHPPKALSWLAWTPSGATIVPVTFGAGVLTATGGAGALLLTPLLLACGFKNERFVVAASTVAVAIHLARISAYGFGGLVDASTVRDATIVGLAIFGGNLVGKQVRTKLDERRNTQVTYGVMVACVLLSVLGVTG